MKKYISEFFRRGLIAGGFGPVALAIFYMAFHNRGVIESLTLNQVCTGIFSLYGLAFIAGGMNILYQLERLPLMVAILIHGSVLYISYLITYLINDWLEWGAVPIMAFSLIFIAGYLAIWLIIFCVTKRKTEKLNRMLKEKQQNIN